MEIVGLLFIGFICWLSCLADREKLPKNSAAKALNDDMVELGKMWFKWVFILLIPGILIIFLLAYLDLL